jgi:hypothetical protein
MIATDHCPFRSFNLSPYSDEFFNESSAAKHTLSKRATSFIISPQSINFDQAEKAMASFTDAIRLAIAVLHDINENPDAPALPSINTSCQDRKLKSKLSFRRSSEPQSGELGNPIFSNSAISIGPQCAEVDVAQSAVL